MVSLGVADLEASIKFYEHGLGLPRLDSPPSVAFFNLNGTWLGLAQRDALAADAGVPSEGAGYTAINLAHNVTSEAEVHQVMELAAKAGATVVKAPSRADWGGYHGYFSDPDGHLWEVAHNPFGWVGPEDN